MGRIAALAVFALLAACFHASALPVTQPETTVVVDNRSNLDMNIYVVRTSQATRIGTASGHATSSFRIPPSFIFGPTPLQFRADPIGSNRLPVTEEITVMAGDEVTLLIPPG